MLVLIRLIDYFNSVHVYKAIHYNRVQFRLLWLNFIYFPGYYNTGMYTQNNRRASIPQPHARPGNEPSSDLPRLTAMAANYFWTAYSTMNGNYVAIATVFLIVLLSFILPDLSQKIHRASELTAMKKVLLKMSVREVVLITKYLYST